jgi:hypothetical protein
MNRLELAAADAPVGWVHACRGDPNEDFVRLRHRNRHLEPLQNLSLPVTPERRRTLICQSIFSPPAACS